jgi:hypothetical protein
LGGVSSGAQTAGDLTWPLLQTIANMVGGISPEQVLKKLAMYTIKVPSDHLKALWMDEAGYRAMQLDDIFAGEAVWGALDNADALRYDAMLQNGSGEDA